MQARHERCDASMPASAHAMCSARCCRPTDALSSTCRWRQGTAEMSRQTNPRPSACPRSAPSRGRCGRSPVPPSPAFCCSEPRSPGRALRPDRPASKPRPCRPSPATGGTMSPMPGVCLNALSMSPAFAKQVVKEGLSKEAPLFTTPSAVDLTEDPGPPPQCGASMAMRPSTSSSRFSTSVSLACVPKYTASFCCRTSLLWRSRTHRQGSCL